MAADTNSNSSRLDVRQPAPALFAPRRRHHNAQFPRCLLYAWAEPLAAVALAAEAGRRWPDSKHCRRHPHPTHFDRRSDRHPELERSLVRIERPSPQCSAQRFPCFALWSRSTSTCKEATCTSARKVLTSLKARRSVAPSRVGTGDQAAIDMLVRFSARADFGHRPIFLSLRAQAQET